MKKFWIVFAVLCLLATSVMGVAAVSAEDVVYGDANGDGRVNNRDLGTMQQAINEWPSVVVDEEAADVNHDGRFNNRDLGLLQQYLNEWDVTLEPDEPVDPDNIFNDTELDWS